MYSRTTILLSEAGFETLQEVFGSCGKWNASNIQDAVQYRVLVHWFEAGGSHGCIRSRCAGTNEKEPRPAQGRPHIRHKACPLCV